MKINIKCPLQLECKFKKSVFDCYKLGKKLDRRPYRLLEQCRKENISNDVWLKEKMLYNVGCAKKDISNSKKLTKDKNKQTEGNLLDNSRYNVKPGKIKKFAYVRGDSHFEEGMSKKEEYENEFRKVAKDDLMILRKRREIFYNMVEYFNSRNSISIGIVPYSFTSICLCLNENCKI
ncbi:hypothetical protein PMALA_047790 [Plasmodium malariae]|uniref:Uncharacterized protein n=1 Tax=Plasmodium malariae TaxID=5858 RepID=A0A1A8WW59_PLAMA|nr:hypothetical protein PMALA_047790 [Plasmodium malariae]